MEEGTERLQGPEVVDDRKETEFSRWLGTCTYELTTMVTACTRAMQTQTRQKPCVEVGKWVRSPNLG